MSATAPVLAIAEMAWNVVRVYASRTGSFSKQRWERSDRNEHARYVDGVLFVLSNRGIEPWELHEHWRGYMIERNWIQGGVKDAGAKVHFNLRPWRELPDREKRKAVLFLAVVRAALMDLPEEPTLSTPVDDAMGGAEDELEQAAAEAQSEAAASAERRGKKRRPSAA